MESTLAASVTSLCNAILLSRRASSRTILVHESASTFHGRAILVDVQKVNKFSRRKPDSTKDGDPGWQLARYSFHATIALVHDGHISLGTSLVSYQ